MLAKKMNIILPIIFLMIATTLIIIAVLTKPRVLILHSYETDYSWVNDIDKGIMRILDKQSYSVRWHYMDTKRHPSDEFKAKAGKQALDTIREWEPNVIIAIDDNAQQWVTKQLINHPKINIVFTGVNGTAEAYNYHKANNVTGVLERLPFDAFRDAFITLLGKEKVNLAHISDNSTTSGLVEKELHSIDWTPLNLVESSQIDTFEQWKEKVKILNKTADALLITHYHTLRESENSEVIIPPPIVAKWTEENTDIPIVGSWGFFVEDGGSMAIAVSAFEQGEDAANMAVDIIEGHVDSPKDIPIKTGKLFMIYINEAGVKRRGIKIPIMLESFARATNTYY